MAPVIKKGGNKPKNGTAVTSKPKSKGSSSQGKKAAAAPKVKPTQQKTKAAKHGVVKKKKRVYTEKELNIPTLNGIAPAGIQKPHGTKKGKTFVDDQESMMTILAMVQAEKEGNLEGKMQRARQMEEIREARKAEMEKNEARRKQKLEDTMNGLRKRKAKKAGAEAEGEKEPSADKPKKKRVSFG